MNCTCPPDGVDPECHSPLTDTSRWALLSDDEIARIRMRSAFNDPLLQELIAEADPPLRLTLQRFWSDEHNMWLYREVSDVT